MSHVIYPTLGNSPTPSPRRLGFTLPGTLVTLGVLGVVTGIVLLLVSRAREHSRPVALNSPAQMQSLESRRLFNTYYFNQLGNDTTGDGTFNHPWCSIAKANSEHFTSGDQLLFAAGQTFAGKLLLDSQHITAGAKPLIVSSYGKGSAILENKIGDAIEIHNLANINLSNLELLGPGRNSNSGDGIRFLNDAPSGSILDHVSINRIEISGFVNGLEMVAVPKDGSGKCGYSNVTIANCTIHDNAQDGLFLRGNFSQTSTQYSFTNVLITHVTASSNYHTIPGVDDENGIDVSDCDNATIQYCTAFNNGCSGNGSVGIWTWDCNRSLIQYCLSFNNHTGRDRDGDGFDLDGGDTNSVLQNNISFGNDGAGLALFQFKYGRPFTGNTIRNNVSINDARKNAYGGIAVGDYGPGISNCQIYSNFVVTNPTEGASPSALQLETPTTNLRIFNNTFITTAGIPLMSIAPGQKELFLSHNRCFTTGSPAIDLQGGH